MCRGEKTNFSRHRDRGVRTESRIVVPGTFYPDKIEENSRLVYLICSVLIYFSEYVISVTV